jgi:hypothetical protein
MSIAAAEESAKPLTTAARRVLWRMKGTRRVIFAVLRHDRSTGYELVVAFEDRPDDVIETQVESSDVHALEQRAETLKQVLRAKGLTPLDVA